MVNAADRLGDELDPDRERAAAQRRAVPVLSAMQVLGGTGVAGGLAVNGLLAQQLSGSTALSGLAQTMGVIGAAALAVPLARLAARRGRRPALTLGYLVASVGAVLSITAGAAEQFWLLLVGATLFGAASACGLQSRYAAIDAAASRFRGRALSVVVWAGTVGSVAGPNLSDAGGRVGRALGLPSLVGPYLFALVGFAAAAGSCFWLLRPDPLAVARRLAGTAPAAAATGIGVASRAVLASPAAVLGMVAVGTAHAVMVAVMVMTPVHLHDGGATLRVVGLVISAHVAGMYAASPVMGWFADRVGRRAGILLGLGVLLAALAVAFVSGPQDQAQLGVALALLGLGWSACLVSGSTLISESVAASVRTAVQGLSDLVMGLAAAVAGVLAGPVLAGWGYPVLAGCAAALLGPAFVLAVATARSDDRPERLAEPADPGLRPEQGRR
jgi:MFS family permease